MSHMGPDLAGQLVNDRRAEIDEATQPGGEGALGDPTRLRIVGVPSRRLRYLVGFLLLVFAAVVLVAGATNGEASPQLAPAPTWGAGPP